MPPKKSKKVKKEKSEKAPGDKVKDENERPSARELILQAEYIYRLFNLI